MSNASEKNDQNAKTGGKKVKKLEHTQKRQRAKNNAQKKTKVIPNDSMKSENSCSPEIARYFKFNANHSSMAKRATVNHDHDHETIKIIPQP